MFISSWTPPAPPEARTPVPGWVLSRGRAQRTIPRIHGAVARALAASGSSHSLSFLTQGTAWGRLRPRDQHPRATCTQKAAAAVAHMHLFPHSPLLPSASDHPCSPVCIYQPILITTQGVAASSTPGPWPRVELLVPSAPHSLPAHLLESRWLWSGGHLWPVGAPEPA